MTSKATDIQTNAVDKPKSVFNDGFRAEQHSIKDQIEADRHAQNTDQATSSGFGIRIGQFRSQGPVV